jgi:hypothetical protein
MLTIFKVEYGECACEDKDTCFVESLENEVDETGPSSVEPDLEKVSIASTDSMNEENPREIHHRPSIRPSLHRQLNLSKMLVYPIKMPLNHHPSQYVCAYPS